MRIMVLTVLGLAVLIGASVVSTLPRGTSVTNAPSVEFDLTDILKLAQDPVDPSVDEYRVI